MSCLQALNELVLVPYLPSPPRAFCSSPAVVGLADAPLPQGLCTCCPRCGGALPLDVPRAHSLTRFSSEASPGHLSITVTCSSEGRPLCLACSLLGPSCWCHFSSSGTLTPRASSSNTSSPPSAHSPPKPQHVPLCHSPQLLPRLPGNPQRDTQMRPHMGFYCLSGSDGRCVRGEATPMGMSPVCME